MGTRRERIGQDYAHGGVVVVLVGHVSEYFQEVLEGLDCGVA
jgi:hypothetical protein